MVARVYYHAACLSMWKGVFVIRSPEASYGSGVGQNKLVSCSSINELEDDSAASGRCHHYEYACGLRHVYSSKAGHACLNVLSLHNGERTNMLTSNSEHYMRWPNLSFLRSDYQGGSTSQSSAVCHRGPPYRSCRSSSSL